MSDKHDGCCEEYRLNAPAEKCANCPRARLERPASLNSFAAEIHADNQHWWHNPATGARLDRNKGEMFMLMVSELAEAMEGERKGLMDDHLPARPMAEVELADTIIRIMDYAGANRLNMEKHADWSDHVVDQNKGAALLNIVGEIVWAFDVESGVVLQRAVHLIEAYAQKYGYDLWGAVAEKRAYNAVRADHKAAARLAVGGKKW